MIPSSPPSSGDAAGADGADGADGAGETKGKASPMDLLRQLTLETAGGDEAGGEGGGEAASAAGKKDGSGSAGGVDEDEDLLFQWADIQNRYIHSAGN